MTRITALVVGVSLWVAPCLSAQCEPCLDPAEVSPLIPSGCLLRGDFDPFLTGSAFVPGWPWTLELRLSSSTVLPTPVLFGVGPRRQTPLDMGSLGVTVSTSRIGCTLEVLPPAWIQQVAQSPEVQLRTPTVSEPALCGLEVWAQAAVVDPGNNPAGVVLSNVTRWKIGRGVPLYDLDFDPPLHTAGQPPVTGGAQLPRRTPGEVSVGMPTVRAAVGKLTNQPLEFDSRDGFGDQIGMDTFNMLPDRRFCCSFRVQLFEVGSPAGTFTILFDSPDVRTVTFTEFGTVQVLVPNVIRADVATYALDEVIDVRIHIDLPGDWWSVRLNDAVVHEGPFGGATKLYGVRMGTRVVPFPPDIHVAMDDFFLASSQ